MWGLVPGKLRVGARSGAFYADQQTGVLAGPAIAMHLKTFSAGKFGSLANLHLEFSQVWGTDKRRMSGLSLNLDALNKMVIGISAQRDIENRVWWLQASVGIRITAQKKPAEPFNE